MDLQAVYLDIPLVTRVYATAAVLTTLACQLQMISPLQLYFNPYLTFHRWQWWRLLTNFLFFGNFGVDFIFHMFFLVRYSRMLEESSFRGKTADFVFMLTIGASFLLFMGPYFSIQFLGNALCFMMVYVWARRNPHTRMSFLGLFTFNAPYLPWVLLAFTLVLNNAIPVVDILGIVIGHIYYYLEDVLPLVTGRHLLKTPFILTWIFDGQRPNLFTMRAGTALPQPAGEQPAATSSTNPSTERNLRSFDASTSSSSSSTNMPAPLTHGHTPQGEYFPSSLRPAESDVVEQVRRRWADKSVPGDDVSPTVVDKERMEPEADPSTKSQ